LRNSKQTIQTKVEIHLVMKLYNELSGVCHMTTNRRKKSYKSIIESENRLRKI
jgi:hypothetical protein